MDCMRSCQALRIEGDPVETELRTRIAYDTVQPLALPVLVETEAALWPNSRTARSTKAAPQSAHRDGLRLNQGRHHGRRARAGRVAARVRGGQLARAEPHAGAGGPSQRWPRKASSSSSTTAAPGSSPGRPRTSTRCTGYVRFSRAMAPRSPPATPPPSSLPSCARVEDSYEQAVQSGKDSAMTSAECNNAFHAAVLDRIRQRPACHPGGGGLQRAACASGAAALHRRRPATQCRPTSRHHHRDPESG